MTFTSTSTDDGAIASTQWDFTDDGTFDASGTSSECVCDSQGAHRAPEGDRRQGCSRETTKTVTVPNQAPVADFSFAPTSPAKGETVNFSSLATDPENRIQSLTWDLNGDNQFTDATGPTAATAFATQGPPHRPAQGPGSGRRLQHGDEDDHRAEPASRRVV